MKEQKEYQVKNFSDTETDLAHSELKFRLENDLKELVDREARMPMFNITERNKAKREISELRKSLNSISAQPLTRAEIFSEEGRANRLNTTPELIQDLLQERKRIQQMINEEENPSIFKKIKNFFSKNERLVNLQKRKGQIQVQIDNARTDQGELANRYGNAVLKTGTMGKIGDMEEMIDDHGTAEDVGNVHHDTVDTELQKTG